MKNAQFSRRHFIHQMGTAAIVIPGLTSLGLQSCGSKKDESTSESPSSTTTTTGSERKLGIALVGLGKYSEGELAPALEKTTNCRLAGIVTGSPDKADTWKKKYDLPDKNVYDYKNFDKIVDNPDIDIVYVVLPNSMHAEYTIRAAKAGKHVICEKPMAMNPEECQQMIDACKKANRQLSIGYRLHFEPHNREMMRLGQQEVFGKVNRIIAEDGQVQDDSTPWRLGGGIGGGGPLRDVGVYCLQGAIYTKGQIPIAVSAKLHPVTDPKKFSKVEEGVDFQLFFADGTTADCKASFNEKFNKLRAEAAKGWFELAPAYAYSGLKGKTSQGKMEIENVPQQAHQMDAFAECILKNQPTTVPGELGMRDVQLIEAIFEAARTGRKVSTKDVLQVMDKSALA
ncbi:Gfo/Idh/MocA family protein [Spirosoma utsteinense]|uniref:Dehydrogenase n=1 Tax=Spirosoma utsteinense TaxID=2585773 RepID=A0ABR6VZ87_9BACT|nr:Gfo/Idh/MocA family oxidoreductase [Spirosoma utsteinense]MBC3784701.1 putative dehydrogenase [Spirosoma utsteinense]MBC3789545.1 putative dehydrogenase [Spirosoma utsteinense]